MKKFLSWNSKIENLHRKIIYPVLFLIILFLTFHFSYIRNRVKVLEILETAIDFDNIGNLECFKQRIEIWSNRFYSTKIIPSGFCDMAVCDGNKKVIIYLTLKNGYLQIVDKLENHSSFSIKSSHISCRYYNIDYWYKILLPITTIFGIFLIVWNIILKNEREKKEKLFSAQEASRFKTFSTITGGIAHNFRNNFHVIKGQLSLIKKDMIACRELHTRERMKEEMGLDETYPDIEYRIKRIKKNLKHCQHIRDNSVIKKIEVIEPVVTSMIEELEQMLDFIRTDKNIKIINVHEVLQVSLELFENCSGEEIDIKFMAQCNDKESTYLIRGNRQSLMTVFLNILNNSLKAKNGKKLSIIIDATFDKKYIYLRFTDNGIGMTLETKARVFEPFYTTDRAKGTGLGLSSSKAILHKIDADINIEWSEIGKGTTVLITFPRSDNNV